MDYGLTCKTIKSSEKKKKQEKIFRIYGKAKGSYTWSTKGKFDKWEFYWNFKSFCSLKDPVERTKRKAIDREKIFGNHVPEKGLVSKYIKYIKNSQNSAVSPPNSPIRKWANIWRAISLKRTCGWQISTRKCSTSFTIRKM